MANIDPRRIVTIFPLMIFVAIGLITLITPTAAVAAADLRIQDQVDTYLSTHPGGRQISPTEVAYSNGALIVSIVRTTALAGPDCPSGWFCFYDGINYTYPRGKLSDCGFQALSTWSWQNRTESAHYNQASGSVVFIDETGSTDTSLFTVSTSRRAIADVGSGRNRADYVFRFC